MRPGSSADRMVTVADARGPAGSEIEIQPCRAANGCPNSVGDVAGARTRVDKLLCQMGAVDMVRRKAGRQKGPLLVHHRLKISLSGCANSCSQPQIADAGLIAQLRPLLEPEECDLCGACVAVCREDALALGGEAVAIDRSACLSCGACVRACPTGALRGEPGWRVLAGGRLGRHPRLASELAAGVPLDEACALVERVVRVWDEQGIPGERVGTTLERLERADQSEARAPIRGES